MIPFSPPAFRKFWNHCNHLLQFSVKFACSNFARDSVYFCPHLIRLWHPGALVKNNFISWTQTYDMGQDNIRSVSSTPLVTVTERNRQLLNRSPPWRAPHDHLGVRTRCKERRRWGVTGWCRKPKTLGKRHSRGNRNQERPKDARSWELREKWHPQKGVLERQSREEGVNKGVRGNTRKENR